MVRSGAAAVDVQPIDRLEEKVRQMVSVIDALRAEKTSAIEESARLQQEVASLKAGIAKGASARPISRRCARNGSDSRAGDAEMISHIDKPNL